MNGEVEARAWVEARFDVPRETMAKLDALAALVSEENQVQNLVAAATLPHIWQRHIADSAQLLLHAPAAGSWADLGTGAGFPGLVIAALRPGTVTLIESRRLRTDFLARAAAALGIDVEILAMRVERVEKRRFDIISARAFAPLPDLLAAGLPLSSPETVWILPKGRSAKTELEALESSWQGEYRVEASLTDPEAGIIVAGRVRRERRGKKR